jgi:hypothetical protein
MPPSYAKLTNCKRKLGQMVNLVNEYYLTSWRLLFERFRNDTVAGPGFGARKSCAGLRRACRKMAMRLTMRRDFAAMRAFNRLPSR